MKVNSSTFREIGQPIYILEEAKLRSNLSLIADVAKRAGVDIILAFKAYALWKTFPIFKEYIGATTASSLYEAKLGFLEFGVPTHTFSPAYTAYEIDEISKCSSHLIFNSLSQFYRFFESAKKANANLSVGLRVNPEYSEIKTMLYNPCAPGTRFGVTNKKLPDKLPNGIEGFHVHCHCENGSDVFVRTLGHIEDKFSAWFPQLKWINFGGGHLMTHSDYDANTLIKVLKAFREKYPWLHVILEPGSAFAWNTGCLVCQVIDIVEDSNIKTAILNVSFTCHMPDCLEMPYHPHVRGAEVALIDKPQRPYTYRLGGNSCLSGDWMGSWKFDHPLQIGENIIFEDMLHYTTVKTNMFNGISHPSIAMLRTNNELEMLRTYTYEDYKSRMD
ncbi:UNVERIFIED_CONTAM: carboxynorspermidine decarboxylase [Prevotella sp. 15_C9]